MTAAQLPPYEPPKPPQRRKFNRICGECDKPAPELFVKRVQFTEMGSRGHVVRSRAVAWLCRPCMEKDPDYNRKKYSASPGHVNQLPSQKGVPPT